MATTRIQIGPADNGRRMTLEEFRDADEEPGYSYELAGGVLEVTEVPNDPHWQIVDNLRELISAYRRQNPGVIQRVGGGGECRAWVVGMASGRNPDVAVVLVGTARDNRGRQPPSLVAEVVSRGGETRDYDTKRAEYLAFGIREYWVVDPGSRRVTVLERREGAGEPAWAEQVWQGDQVIAGALLPGFAGTVAELWADAELEENGAG
jgi:Uma2 family endonuclease